MRVLLNLLLLLHTLQICCNSRDWKDPSECCEEGSACTAIFCYSSVWDNSSSSDLGHSNEVLNAWLLRKCGHPLPYPSSNSKSQALVLLCCLFPAITGSSQTSPACCSLAYSLRSHQQEQPRVGCETSSSLFIVEVCHALEKNNPGQIIYTNKKKKREKTLLYSKEFITVFTFLTMVLQQVQIESTLFPQQLLK